MTIRFGEGWRPGLIGWTVAQHGSYYAENWGFGPFFEAKVARDMAEFVLRIDSAGNHVLWAADDEGLLATVSLDGEQAEQRLTHLRWFIAGERSRGQGLGRDILRRAVSAARKDDMQGIYLTTFAGLDAARALYEAEGFKLVSEADDMTWGVRVCEQRFEVQF